MDIVFLALVVIAALLLPRNRALVVTPVVWAVSCAFVAWGPAHNDQVHTDSIGFWGPWSIALAVGLGVVLLIDAVRRRRQRSRATG